MQSLQIALLLIGCALSSRLWELQLTIARVVLGVTSCGIEFYLFIVVAGALYESCPYQTPSFSAHPLHLGKLPLRLVATPDQSVVLLSHCHNLMGLERGTGLVPASLSIPAIFAPD